MIFGIVQIGDSYTFKDSKNREYFISCENFKNHNHKDKPLYYSHGQEMPDDIVITLESDDPLPYQSPYSGTIQKEWTIFRERCIFYFSIIDKTTVEIAIQEQ